MPVYKRSYRSYAGPLTPAWRRFLVITRYGLEDAWQSRVTTRLLIVCLVPALGVAFTIYLFNSDALKLLLGVGVGSGSFKIDGNYFFGVFRLQCWLAMVLTAWVGPRLMASDLANNALPVLLSRPIRRREYLAGKLAVLGLLLSAVTWAPASLLFLLQTQLAKNWALSHLYILCGLLLGSLLWIAVLSLLTLAVAAWVKWRIMATALVFGVVLAPAGVGEMFNQILNSRWGSLISVPRLMTSIWQRLLRVQSIPSRADQLLPVPAALLALALICAACLLVLNARIRSREVVRG
jgi:ABC-type transport system involved in multi-copper enzyme maturation permease subunit